MLEVDVFTTSEKQLRDLAASFSRLRLQLQFGARLHSGIADLTPAARKHRHSRLLARCSRTITDKARRAT